MVPSGWKLTPVPVLWPGETFLIVGSGPSLDQQDVLEASMTTRVIYVNDAYEMDHFGSVLYAADAQWWRWKRKVPDVLMPELKFAAQPEALIYRDGLQIVNVVKGDGISTDPNRICSGGHSGHQAINLAVLLAGGTPKQIILLGFDMQADPATGRNHFFGEHPHGYHLNYPDKIRRFGVLADDLARLSIPIVNCSRQTAIPESIIPRRPLEEVMRDCAPASRPARLDHQSPHEFITASPATR